LFNEKKPWSKITNYYPLAKLPSMSIKENYPIVCPSSFPTDLANVLKNASDAIGLI
jgi:hypothetical protein